MVLREFFIFFYTTIIITGIIGNVCVVAAIFKYKRLRTPVHIFLVNVSLSDLLFIVLSSWNAAEFLLKEWTFGDAICRLSGCLVEASYTISVWSLAAVSIERFFSICTPHKKERTVTKCVKGAIFIWFIALFVCSPLLYGYTVLPNENNELDCSNNHWTRDAKVIYYSIHTGFVYLLPLFVMIMTHYKISKYLRSREHDQNDSNDMEDGLNDVCRRYVSERKKLEKIKAMKKRCQNLKVIKILIVIIALFFSLFSPYMIMRMLKFFDIYVNEMVWKGSNLLLLATCAVNFFIYAFMSKRLRKVFKSFFTCGRLGVNTNDDSRIVSSNFEHSSPSVKKQKYDSTVATTMV